MAASKRRTTMAKLNRERKLIERRLEKQAKKRERKAGSAQAPRSAEEGLADDEA